MVLVKDKNENWVYDNGRVLVCDCVLMWINDVVVWYWKHDLEGKLQYFPDSLVKQMFRLAKSVENKVFFILTIKCATYHFLKNIHTNLDIMKLKISVS